MPRSRLALALAMLIGASVTPVYAQSEPPVDSLIAYFLENGVFGNWQPYRLFDGCPDLEEWQERGIRQLLAADLSRERMNDLAAGWWPALRDCRDPRLEQWYFEQLDRAIDRGDSDYMLSFWSALKHSDSPQIREYLRNLMLNVDRPQDPRSLAGSMLFARLGREDGLREYLRVFETMRMPAELAWGQTQRLLKQDPERLLDEVGRLVRVNPAVGDQMAFRAVVISSVRYASEGSRRRLGEALQAGLDQAGADVTASRRTQLTEAAAHLKRPVR